MASVQFRCCLPGKLSSSDSSLQLCLCPSDFCLLLVLPLPSFTFLCPCDVTLIWQLTVCFESRAEFNGDVYEMVKG